MARMDYRRLIETDNSKLTWDLITKDVIKSPINFQILIDLYTSEKHKDVKHIGQVIGKVAEKQPQLFDKSILRIFNHLADTNSNSVKRNTLKAFQFINIPESIEGQLYDLVYNYLTSNTESIAVRAFSITVLRRICENHQDLIPELIETIQLIQLENKSAAIQSRSKHELKKLAKLVC